MKMNKLKPCPFCGGKASICIDEENMEKGFAHKWYIVCDSCATCSGMAVSEKKAVEAWNRRADNGK